MRVCVYVLTMSNMLTVLITLLVVFLIAKWFVNTGESHPSTRNLVNNNNTSQTRSRQQPTRNRPTINNTLIQQVQSVAPSLHIEQIKYALQLNNNNVHLVIENYLNGRDFPFPPGYIVPLERSDTTATTTDPRKISNIKQDNLLQKFNVNDNMSFDPNSQDLLQRKQFMIYNARQEMKQKLINDPNWSSLLQQQQ